MNTSSGPLYAAGAEWRPAGAAPRPPAVPFWSSYGAPAPVAGARREPAAAVPSCGVLLGEFLAVMGRIEADFTMRWDAARLGVSR